tara:strand:+ start:192 stop:722 length:531 start_codon:yes stop_codon:yes gene_type:complete
MNDGGFGNKAMKARMSSAFQASLKEKGRPLWRKTFDGSIYADFLNGDGICIWRESAGDWLSLGLNYSNIHYNNEQWTDARYQGSNRLMVVFYQGMTNNYELSPKQTKKWNEYYGFTPHVRQPKSTAQLQKEAENQLLREIEKWQNEYQKTSEKLVKVAKNIEECTYQLKLLKEGGV